MPVPTPCRMVMTVGIESNGTDLHPAVITRSWSSFDTALGAVAVNLTVFPDCAPPVCRSSVMLYEHEEAARAHHAANPGSVVAFWPQQGAPR